MMKVYWIENDKGERYGNARIFTSTGVPKLYGKRKLTEDVIDYSLGWRTRRYGEVFHVVEGELSVHN